MDATPRITELQIDPRRPGTVRLEIDGARFGAVPRDLVAAEGLTAGQLVGADLLERLGAAADIEAAYHTALRCLELRSYARGDLGRRLQRKGHPRQAVEAALQRIVALGLLDDEAYARNYIQTRSMRGRGPARLTRDLLAMGVPRSVIDRAIAAEWPEGTDLSTVPLALATKRAAQLGTLPRQTRRRRVLAYLARRGFSGRVVTEMVEKVV